MQPDELKALRKAAGMSQAELGDAIGLSRITVGLMERGAAPIEKRTAMLMHVLPGFNVIGPDRLSTGWAVVRRFEHQGAFHTRLVAVCASQAEADAEASRLRQAAPKI